MRCAEEESRDRASSFQPAFPPGAFPPQLSLCVDACSAFQHPDFVKRQRLFSKPGKWDELEAAVMGILRGSLCLKTTLLKSVPVWELVWT